MIVVKMTSSVADGVLSRVLAELYCSLYFAPVIPKSKNHKILGRTEYDADPHNNNNPAWFGIIFEAIARLQMICLEGRVEKTIMNQ